MSALLALLLAAFPFHAEIRGFSVSPAEEAGETRITIYMTGNPGSIEHFLLSGPDRLVLDIGESRIALAQDRYPGVGRGGVKALRTSQYQPDVTRVVLDLDGHARYSIERVEEGLSITMPNPGGSFEEWRIDVAAGPKPAPVPVKPPPVAHPPLTELVQEPERISVFFQETPLRDVLATFSEFSGRSIVAGTGVAGQVDADIRDQYWDVALQEILHAHNLTARETETGIIRVSDLRSLRERVDFEELITRAFTIRYISVDSILGAVQGLLADVDTAETARRRSSVVTNRSTNTLFVTAGASVLERIEPLIEDLDVRTPQVTISAQIIFVDRTALEEFGVVYDLKDSRGNRINTLIRPQGDPTDVDVLVTLGGSSIAGLGNANARVSAPNLRLVGSLVLGRHSLVSFIEALGQETLTDIQARPMVTTMSHREARVQVGERTPVRILDPGTAVGPGQVGARAVVEMVETGVILRVTPHVTGDQILLDLHAERSNVALAPSDIGYTFQTQESETQVLMNDGETAVIGGLTVTEKHEVRSGIPILMNLPFVGALFRMTTDREVKQDLLIMVTPHIVRDGDPR